MMTTETEALHIPDALYDEIDAQARRTYTRHRSSIRGQQVTRADSFDTHLIYHAYQSGYAAAKAETAEQDNIRSLKAQLAEAQRRIKELETPTMFWDFDNPEHGAFDSPYYAICDGDFDEGAEVSFMTARSLPTKTVRVTRDSKGNYDYEYINAAKDV